MLMELRDAARVSRRRLRTANPAAKPRATREKSGDKML